MSIYDKASLVLIPSGTKTSKVYSQKPTNGDGDFTFSRSTAATRVNAGGNIEKETGNLILQSNSFNTTWSTSNASVTSGQSGYDGSSDAWLFTATNTAANLIQSVSSSGVNTFSIYAKAGTQNGIFLRADGGDNPRLFFKLNTGTIGSEAGTIIDSSIESVGNGWYRVSLVVNVSITQVRLYVADDNNNFPSSGNIYIQDAQLEQGLVARDVITTTTSAIYGGITDNVPRLDYTDSSCPALLLEPQRSNLLIQSEYFNGWAQINTITTDNSINSPEGVQNAAKLVASSGYSNKVIYQGITANTYTASVFAKKGELEGLVIATGTTGAFFNLNTQSFRADYSAPVTSYKIENYGNGWFRYSITFTEAGANNLYIGPNDNVSTSLAITGDGTSGIYIYGATLEAGSYATSYIPTYGRSVTRNQDGTGDNKYGDAVDTWAIMYEFDFDKMALQNNIVFSNISSHSSSNTNISFRIFTKYNTHHCIAPYFNVDSEYPFSTNTDNNKVDKNVLLRANGDGSFDYFTNFNDTITKQSVSGNTAIEWGKMNLKGSPQTAYKRIVLVKQALTDEQCESLMG